MVVLDEPTSAVDIRTEAAIMDAIEKLMHGRTTFMIAHRLSTLERCDVVLVMREGRLQMITHDLSEAKEQLIHQDAATVRSQPLGPVLVS